VVGSIFEHAEFSGKPSTPYTPESVHDYMHAKVVVADDVSFVGSFNLSRSGERNAENVLELHDAETADRLAEYIDAIRAVYPPSTVPLEAQNAPVVPPPQKAAPVGPLPPPSGP
jgi:phosphatidylserine/phosphatidylglycerophosphate/cardiolipin synthase-like enzyme